jgi:hypothetical protein
MKMIPQKSLPDGFTLIGYAVAIAQNHPSGQAHDSVCISGLTNGMVLSGNVQFPIQFAVSTTDTIVGVVFYDTSYDTNGSPISGASCEQTPDGVGC